MSNEQHGGPVPISREDLYTQVAARTTASL